MPKCDFYKVAKRRCFSVTFARFLRTPFFKGAAKFYFTHYSCVIIILSITGLCRSAFSTISFRKPVFRLSVLSVFLL